jgi:hypothetical protein
MNKRVVLRVISFSVVPSLTQFSAAVSICILTCGSTTDNDHPFLFTLYEY